MRVAVVFTLLLLGPLYATAQEIGPVKGSLVVAGGGSLRDSGILERFLDLAGGGDQPIVVIPTAGEQDEYDESWDGLRELRAAGARTLTVLHTRDRSVADTDAFAAPILAARGVWFPGGRQWRLADSYLNTRTHRALTALLERGGVIGGTSAGATIQGSFMVRGDTKGNELMVGDHVDGLAFLKNVTIDQHLLKRNRQFDLLPVIEARPQILGVGIDESTAIIVRGDAFEVIGRSYVAIYDAQRRLDSGGQFYLLAPGDRYDMKTRHATRPTTKTEPLGRVVKEPWRRPSSR
jgi:cyanophycinase